MIDFCDRVLCIGTKCLRAALCLLITTTGAAAQTVFINEFHYDNFGVDQGEFIEIAGPAGTDLSGWGIVRYNGTAPGNAVVYTTPAATETFPPGTIIPNIANGFGFVVINYPQDGLQNGPNDALALVNASSVVVQFLSYEGTATAGNGPAAGMTSSNIPVSETGSSTANPAGSSLQLSGTGTVYADFTWVVRTQHTSGAVNTGQTFGAGGGEIGACADPATRIHAIQGAGPTSPMIGTTVNIEGIVVASYQGPQGLPGFFLQEPDSRRDADAGTSEGIFVFDQGSSVAVQRGDVVRVRGTVSEFGNGGSTLTELASVSGVIVCQSGQLAQVTPTVVSLPLTAVSEWERYEGMLIRIDQPLAVTGNFNLGQFGEVDVAVSRLFSPTQVVEPGAAAIARQDLNDRSRIVLDDGSNLSRQNFDPPARLFPEGGGLSAANTLRVGDRVTDVNGGQGITGVLDQRFGAYRMHPVNQPVYFHTPAAANPRPAAPPAVGGTLRVASFNVLNYFTTLDTGTPACGPTLALDCRGANSAAEFTRQRDKIISAIRALDAHVVGLIELENNPHQSVADLVDGLNSAPGTPGTWAFVNTGTIGTDAIKVGFIYRTAAVAPLGPHAVLTSAVDPRVIDTKSRPPLAQTFRETATNQRLTVVVNHFKSKGSDCNTAGAPGELIDPDTGDGQGNCNLTRVSIAQALVDWLASDPTGSGDRDVLIIGDLNAYALEHPVRALTDPSFDPPDPANAGHPGFGPNPGATYVNVGTRFLGLETYSFQFTGQSGSLDHALASRSLSPLVTGAAHWHINADEPVALDYNTEWTATINKNANQLATLYAANVYKSADHDPLLVGLNLVCGDLNDDSRVDAADLALFKAALGSKHGDKSYNRRADYDLDGQVTLRDYQMWVNCSRGRPLASF